MRAVKGAVSRISQVIRCKKPSAQETKRRAELLERYSREARIARSHGRFEWAAALDRLAAQLAKKD